MRQLSLVHVKSHLSELVDAAEHRGKRVVILRHGKPAAALVPLSDVNQHPRPRRMNHEDARAFLEGLSQLGDDSFSAVADLLASRR